MICISISYLVVLHNYYVFFMPSLMFCFTKNYFSGLKTTLFIQAYCIFIIVHSTAVSCVGLLLNTLICSWEKFAWIYNTYIHNTHHQHMEILFHFMFLFLFLREAAKQLDDWWHCHWDFYIPYCTVLIINC